MPLPLRDFDYELPADRIAQQPLARRDASRLLHVAAGGSLSDRTFTDLPALLQRGDLVVANETRVRRARLLGTRADGGDAELLVLRARDDGEYVCLVRPARRLPPGSVVAITSEFRAVIGQPCGEHEGARAVRFESSVVDIESALLLHGRAPLPPYNHHDIDEPERYQTLYARGQPGSAAAPTAGLHFTPGVIDQLQARGVGWATVRLDIGAATFTPIRVDDVTQHVMHEECFELPDATATAIAMTRAAGGRIICAGTTTLRVLETQATEAGMVNAGSGSTRLFVTPGYRFRVADALLTNFHQPRSSLLVLLAAFIGDRWRDAYQHALRAGYHFLSFGDCMLCWPPP